MLPITSVTKVEYLKHTVPWSATAFNRFYETKTKYRQKKPYNLNLPYSYWRCMLLSYQKGYSDPMVDVTTGSSVTGHTPFSHVNGYPQSTSFTAANRLVADVTSKARERFVSTMKGSAGLGVDLAEAKQSISMIENRAVQLFQFSRALRKGQVFKAAEILGVRDHPKTHKILKRLGDWEMISNTTGPKRARWRLRPQNRRILTTDDLKYSNLWLEFHFGWSPLVADVYDSIDILQRDIPAGRIIGRARGSEAINLSKKSGTATYTNLHQVSVNVVVGATVKMNNPNLALANQLGLVNPATLVWEVIPFSFVVDWFVNVGDFLGSFTEFAGYTITDPFTRVFTSDTSEYTVRDTAGIPYYGTSLAGSTKWTGSSANRVLSLPGVTLEMRTPWRLSVSRAATAVSLLIQQGFHRI